MLSAHGLGLDPRGAELPREVVGVVDPGGVDDAGRRVEAVAVETRGRLVDQLVVEDLGERLLVEVAAHDRHGRDRGRRRDPQRAQRGDQPAPRRVAEREVVHGGREDVGDLLRDQLLRGRHPDVERLGEAADRGARLLAEGGMRLVADDELVRRARDRVHVAREPGVRLDRDRILVERLLAGLDRRAEAAAVSLGREVAVELVHEQPAVRQDEDAHRPGGLHESGRGDRLARGGRMAEAEAPLGSGVGGRLDHVRLVVVRLALRGLRERHLVELVLFLDVGIAVQAVRRSPRARSLRAISSVSMPASASIWWRRSSVPDARRAGWSAITRSSPSISA